MTTDKDSNVVPLRTPEQLRLEEKARLGTLKLDLAYPMYHDLVDTLGLDKRAHACWNYYICAMKATEKVGRGIEDQIIYEGQMWNDLHYPKQAMSVAGLYGLESPEEMFKFWHLVDNTAIALGMPKAHDVIRKGREAPKI